MKENDKIVEVMEKESNKVTNLLSFLLEVPDLATQLTGIHQERIQIMNITRLAVTEYWLEEMKKRIRKLYGEKMFDNFDKVKSLLSVK